ncbi:hypothetical protein Psuf_044350 [Phytohabitans suffuscus]|uniref:Uncharacterized protein n=1 Tax=Phytohabitans suffuscus TaxID=624315 RepID=A0A6F8YLY2_9ACTN|nr:hypothetical protein Psuf_044350 [Phytohabitans suffuscus]
MGVSAGVFRHKVPDRQQFLARAGAVNRHSPRQTDGVGLRNAQGEAAVSVVCRGRVRACDGVPP